jgi:predicted DNA-binding protein (MmcQ/YjbR family)
MFALSALSQWEKGEPSVNLKCDPERAQELRAQFDDIKPGWHMSKIHWNTVAINKAPDPLVKELIDHSYELVHKSLTKKMQEEILKIKPFVDTLPLFNDSNFTLIENSLMIFVIGLL